MTTRVLPSEIRHANAMACLKKLQAEIDQPGTDAGPVVIDASAVTQFDSSAIAILLEGRRRALAAGRQLVVKSLPPDMARLAQVYGVHDLIQG